MVFADNEGSDMEQGTEDEYKSEDKEDSRTAALVKELVPIDEHHPVVQDLLSLDYELEHCLQAAELFPDDATQAQEYLMDIGEKGELFASSIQTCGYETYHSDGNLRPSNTVLTLGLGGVAQPNIGATKLTVDE